MRALLCLILMAACASRAPEDPAAREGDPQRDYSYAGCPNTDGFCPRLDTVACALKTIAANHDACAGAGDCAVVSIDGKCTGGGSCPPYAVNASQRAAFTAEADAEISRYCEGAACASAGLCAADFSGVHPACIGGHCRLSP